MGTGGRDTDKIEAVAREFKMDRKTRRKFGKWIEKLKGRGEFGAEPNGDFTYAELQTQAEDFLGGDQ